MFPIHSWKELLWKVILGLLIAGFAYLAGCIVTKVIRRNGYQAHTKLNLILSVLAAVAIYLRYGATLVTVQGLFLFFVLLYASWSDISTMLVGDYIWVLILALSLVGLRTETAQSMLLGALVVFLPQWLLSVIPPHKTLGGADIKISTSLAFLLGFPRGIVAYLLGLLLAIIGMSIYNKAKQRSQRKSFALVPFLGISAMLVFLI